MLKKLLCVLPWCATALVLPPLKTTPLVALRSTPEPAPVDFIPDLLDDVQEEPPETFLRKTAYAVREVGKYGVATTLQFGTLAGVLVFGLERCVLNALASPLAKALAVGLAFEFLAVRSRWFSLLEARRPNVKEQEGRPVPTDVERPKILPPTVVFKIVWTLNQQFRAVSSALAFAATSSIFVTLPLVLHLAVGDTWNSINNVEKRLGVSAVGVLAVWGSLLASLVAYYQATPLACYVLAPTFLWISIATVLTNAIWLKNGGPSERPPFPARQDGSSAPLRIFQFRLE